MNALNLLTAPLIRAVVKNDGSNNGAFVEAPPTAASEAAASDVEAPEKEIKLSLPDVFAALMRDEIVSFPALRPHQRSAWHMFLAHLGALALLRNEQQALPPPERGERWAELLRKLTEDDSPANAQKTQVLGDAPWCLVVKDVTLPAFLQPPFPTTADAKKEGAVFPTPDELDLPVTAKNFDLKRSIIRTAEPDDWLFALICFQTMNGYTGRGHQGVMRMNGGFSSRPFFGLGPLSGGPGARLKRDIRAMLAQRDSLVEEYGDIFAPQNGKALLWLVPWDGKSSLRPTELDIWFLEICRRVRLEYDENGAIVAEEATADKTRVAAPENLKGVTGDFWAPIENAKDGLKAFSATSQGFTTSKICEILFGTYTKKGGLVQNWTPPPSFKQLADEKGKSVLLEFSVLTRGQGKTEGYHERIIPFSSRAQTSMLTPEKRGALGKLAQEQLEQLDIIDRALSLACATYAAKGKKPDKEDYRFNGIFQKQLDMKSDAQFFSVLQDRLDEQENGRSPDACPRYLDWLGSLALYAGETILKEAEQTIPCPAIRQMAASARAENSFYGILFAPKTAFVGKEALRKLRHPSTSNSEDSLNEAHSAAVLDERETPEARAPNERTSA